MGGPDLGSICSPAGAGRRLNGSPGLTAAWPRPHAPRDLAARGRDHLRQAECLGREAELHETTWAQAAEADPDLPPLAPGCLAGPLAELEEQREAVRRLEKEALRLDQTAQEAATAVERQQKGLEEALDRVQAAEKVAREAWEKPRPRLVNRTRLPGGGRRRSGNSASPSPRFPVGRNPCAVIRKPSRSIARRGSRSGTGTRRRAKQPGRIWPDSRPISPRSRPAWRSRPGPWPRRRPPCASS